MPPPRTSKPGAYPFGERPGMLIYDTMLNAVANWMIAIVAMIAEHATTTRRTTRSRSQFGTPSLAIRAVPQRIAKKSIARLAPFDSIGVRLRSSPAAYDAVIETKKIRTAQRIGCGPTT